MSSWPLRIVVILVGFAGGFIIWRANNGSSRSCGKWADVSTAILDHGDDLVAHPQLDSEAASNLTTAAIEMETHRNAYSEHRWHTPTPSEPASDLLLDATKELAEPGDHAPAMHNLKDSLDSFEKVCK